MLDSSTTVVIYVLLDLRLSFSEGRLIDRHLYILVKICHDYRSERRVLSMDHFVINRPESVEVEHLLVPLGNWFHFHIRLISYAMINEV